MIQVLAHRGASAYAPENTLEAFELAVDMGADGIETDVHVTKDGALVLCHDFDTLRVTGRPGFIADMTLSQLRELNFAATFEGHRARIPTLEETLDLLGSTRLLLNIEIKAGPVIYDGIERRLLEAVAKSGMRERVIYSSFNHYSLKMIKAMNPGAKIGLLYQTALYEPWRYAAYVGADAIHPYYVTLKAPNVVRDCHMNGIAVHPWTVDDPAHLKMVMALGVDAVITDTPDRAIAIREGLTANR